MKLKGINPIEQHVEKLVLGVVALVFLGVLTLQFLGSPNAVDVGSGRTVPPDRVYLALEQRAQTMLGEMQSAPVLPEVARPELSSRLAAIMSGSGAENAAVADAVPFGESFSVGTTDSQVLTGPVMDVRLPVPGEVTASSQWGTVDPYFVQAYPQVREALLRQEQPFDLASVSAEAVFDGTALRALLEGADDGRRPIPSPWWARGMAVLSVEVERQVRGPGDAEWGEAEVVPHPFWAPSLNEAAGGTGPVLNPEGLTPADVERLTSLALADLALVAQPAFVPQIAGTPWRAPRDARTADADLERFQEIERIRTQLERAQDKEQRLVDAIARRAARPATTTQRDPPRRDPSGSGRGGGRNDPAPAAAPTTRPEPVDRQQQELDATRVEIAELTEALNGLMNPDAATNDPAGTTAVTSGVPTGIDPRISTGAGPGFPGSNFDPGRSFSSGSGLAASKPLLEDEAFRVWVHDVKVRPGYAYRYRFRVGVNNPLFGRERLLGTDAPADLLARSAEPLAKTEWSSWSEPATVDRAEYFFIVNASEQGSIGPASPSATAEVYQMYYGHYRRASVRLDPGAPIVATMTLPEDVELFQFNVEGLNAATLEQFGRELEQRRQARLQQQTQPAQPTATPTDPGRGVTPPGTDPGRAPRGPGRVPPTPVNTGAAPAGATPGQTAEAELVLPEGVERVATELTVPIDAVMLDVAETVSGDEGSVDRVVFLVDPLEGIVERSVAYDREHPSYARMRVSAWQSETAVITMPKAPVGP